MKFHYQSYELILAQCPKTHKYAYNNGKWCCNTNKDCKDKPLKRSSKCCQYWAYKECPSKNKKCENHASGKNLLLESIFHIFLLSSIIVIICFVIFNQTSTFSSDHKAPPPDPEIDNCTDKGKHCKYWKKQGYCKKAKGHVRYMKTNCKKSCSFCDAV